MTDALYAAWLRSLIAAGHIPQVAAST